MYNACTGYLIATSAILSNVDVFFAIWLKIGLMKEISSIFQFNLIMNEISFI